MVPLWNRNIYFGWCWSWHVATLPLNGVTLQIYFTGALVSLRLIDSIVFIWSPLSPMLLFASACCQEVSLSIVQEDTITLVYEYLCLPGQPLEHLLPVVQAGGEYKYLGWPCELSLASQTLPGEDVCCCSSLTSQACGLGMIHVLWEKYLGLGPGPSLRQGKRGSCPGPCHCCGAQSSCLILANYPSLNSLAVSWYLSVKCCPALPYCCVQMTHLQTLCLHVNNRHSYVNSGGITK